MIKQEEEEERKKKIQLEKNKIAKNEMKNEVKDYWYKNFDINFDAMILCFIIWIRLYEDIIVKVIDKKLANGRLKLLDC